MAPSHPSSKPYKEAIIYTVERSFLIHAKVHAAERESDTMTIGRGTGLDHTYIVIYVYIWQFIVCFVVVFHDQDSCVIIQSSLIS